MSWILLSWVHDRDREELKTYITKSSQTPLGANLSLSGLGFLYEGELKHLGYTCVSRVRLNLGQISQSLQNPPCLSLFPFTAPSVTLNKKRIIFLFFDHKKIHANVMLLKHKSGVAPLPVSSPSLTCRVKSMALTHWILLALLSLGPATAHPCSHCLELPHVPPSLCLSSLSLCTCRCLPPL